LNIFYSPFLGIAHEKIFVLTYMQCSFQELNSYKKQLLVVILFLLFIFP